MGLIHILLTRNLRHVKYMDGCSGGGARSGGGAGSPNNKMWEWGPSINRIYAYNNVMVALYYDICGQNFLFYYSFC